MEKWHPRPPRGIPKGVTAGFGGRPASGFRTRNVSNDFNWFRWAIGGLVNCSRLLGTVVFLLALRFFNHLVLFLHELLQQLRLF